MSTPTTGPSIHRRRPVWFASLLCAAALAAGPGPLAPAPAAASPVRRVDAVAYGSGAHRACAPKRPRPSGRGRGRAGRGCARGRTVKRRHPRARKPAKRPRRGRGTQPPPSAPRLTPAGGPPAVPGLSAGPFPEPPPDLLPSGGAETDPIDPRYLTAVPFGTSSFWVQPWRAYLDTWPASRLLDSLGVNFNVSAAQAQATAQLLQDSGFELARIEINWSSLSYEDPTRFVNEAHIRARLEALHDHGLRPLILLNANSEAPTPARQVTLETAAPAPAGAQTVTLTPASAAAVVPGRTGFDRLSFGGDPDILITSVAAGGFATLSRPLPSALAAGEHRGSTLLYAPFGAPYLENGEPNPAFRATLAGWLGYVAAVCREAASVFGPEGYDLEVWNELSFGSQFLNAEYYGPAAASEPEEAEAGPGAVTKEITKALLQETVAYVRNPANGIPAGVGISDGFASQTPFPSGAKAPPGLTALSKHLYAGAKSFPADYPAGAIRPIDALGARDTGSNNSFAPLFIPHYQSLLPEYFLTATSTETAIRDLAPFTTYVYGYPHGREVAPPGGGPPQKWMTEYNLSTAGATPVGPDETTPEPVTLTPADKAHFQAKALLRSLVATISKGMTREYFYAATGGALGLIDKSFFTALEADPGAYPGDRLGGETMNAFRNLLTPFQGPGPTGAPRQLQLLSIAQEGDHAQFSGDGTPAHPSLYDREVLAVFPFQASPTRFEIPVYVMTRDLLTLYRPEAPATDTARFDLPDETFHITLGNLPETSAPPTVSAYDPLRDETTPAQLRSRAGASAVFEIAATDYPRILTIDFAPAS
jgi:hypothetical protein